MLDCSRDTEFMHYHYMYNKITSQTASTNTPTLTSVMQSKVHCIAEPGPVQVSWDGFPCPLHA